ncbi:MAG: glycosyltransferase family 4 protein [bacterium]|nr:glycosyltransferase family 4 protein [bacterium]
MNILALNWNDLKNPYAGGAEVHLEELLRRLAGYGHKVTLFCSGWSGCLSEENIKGVRVVRRGNRYNFNLIAPTHLRRLAREERFDILIEDINKIPFYTPLYLDLKRLIVIPHLFATTVFRETNFVLGSYIYMAERPMVSIYRKYKFNVISESTADDMAERGVPRENISIVHCGIDRELYAHDPDVTKYEQPTILYLGRIKKYKSVQHLIQALALVRKEVPEARLMIVGSGDYTDHLKSLAENLGLANDVEFPGFVSPEEKVDRMRRSHVCVLPSPKEGWGLTNIESSSVGTAVVAANSPGLRDSVSDGVSGFLYPYGDVAALAEKLLAVLKDDEVRMKLEQGGLEWAKRFDWDDAARKFEKILLEVAGEAA